MPRIAKIFQSGHSQTVRLPTDSRFKVDEVEVSHEGGAIILRSKADANRPWALLRAAVERGFSADFIVDGRDQPKEQERPELVQAFQ